MADARESSTEPPSSAPPVPENSSSAAASDVPDAASDADVAAPPAAGEAAVADATEHSAPKLADDAAAANATDRSPPKTTDDAAAVEPEKKSADPKPQWGDDNYGDQSAPKIADDAAAAAPGADAAAAVAAAPEKKSADPKPQWGDDDYGAEAAAPPAVREAAAADVTDRSAPKIADGAAAAAPEKKSADPKPQWGDDDYGDEPDLASFGTLKVSSDEPADKREAEPKATSLNENDGLETEIRKVIPANTPYTSAKSFEDLNLSESLLRGIYSGMRFDKPSQIQAETLPLITQPPYSDLIAQAHNGSGKTTCFVLGMLSRVDVHLKAPQALCVCPTRELAVQNEEVLLKMATYTNITSASTASSESGGAVLASRRGPVVDQVVFGTPGTLKRWMTRDRILSTKNIQILVFDEADHMLDQSGFQDDSLRIINHIKQSRGGCQIVLFSATFSEKVKAFAMKIVPQANFIFVEKEKLSLDVIKQYKVKCPDIGGKITVLKDKIFPAAERLGQSIIFVRTRHSASAVHRGLEADGFRCSSIQGGLQHEERDKVIREFRSGQTKVLISTDVLARGFDQAQVTLVVNFDLPETVNTRTPDFELYLHRIGRSGRFGRRGAAFNLIVDNTDERNVGLIERHFNREIVEVPFDDDDAFERVLKDAGLA